MKTHRLHYAVALLLLIVIGGLVWGDSTALAAVSIASRGTTTIPYSGTVDGTPESVFLSGLVQIATVVVRDPDFGKPPIVLLSIDLSSVTGTGVKTGARYVTSGNQNLIRPLVPVDVVEITFAFFPSRANGAALARSALASFTLTYNVAGQRLTQATASTAVNVADSLGAFQPVE